MIIIIQTPAGRIVGYIPFPKVLVVCEMQEYEQKLPCPTIISVIPEHQFTFYIYKIFVVGPKRERNILK